MPFYGLIEIAESVLERFRLKNSRKSVSKLSIAFHIDVEFKKNVYSSISVLKFLEIRWSLALLLLERLAGPRCFLKGSFKSNPTVCVKEILSKLIENICRNQLVGNIFVPQALLMG